MKIRWAFLFLLLLSASARGGIRILFAATNETADGTFELYTMTDAGTDLRRLTTNAVSEYGPALASDGQSVAYIDPALPSSNLFVLAITGGPPVAVGITNNALAVQWGVTNLYFLRFVGGAGTVQYELWRVNRNGSGETRVYTNVFETWPVGAEDFLVDRVTQKVYLSAFVAPFNSDICVGALNSNTYQRVLPTCSFHLDNYNPAVSPNGLWLAQAADTNGNPGLHRLYVGSSTGGCGTLVCEEYCGSPAWEPYGQWLAFARASNSTWGGQAYVGDIWRVGSGGGGLSNLTQGSAVAGGSAFPQPYEEPGTKIIYVATNSPSPTPPFTNWSTAARTIQEAVDAGRGGDTVLLTNGTYVLSNQVIVATNLTITSVNGPTVTIVNARASNRVFYLNYPNSGIERLTIKNGYTTMDGGGVYGPSNSFIRNCIVVSNRCGWDGGGAFLNRGGLVEDCTFFANRTDGNGGYGGGGLCLRYTGTVRRTVILSNVSFFAAGGVYAQVGKIEDCTIRSNLCSQFGGGAHLEDGGHIRESIVEYNGCNYGGGGIYCENGATAMNCRVVGNYNGNDFGAGIYLVTRGYAINCTVVSNRSGAAGQGGGVYLTDASCYLQNCIVQYNYAGTGPNWYQGSGSHVQYCCTTPTNDTDVGCITNEPGFVSLTNRDYHLTTTSACVNAGLNGVAPGANDLDGAPRIRGGIVDMGCYEQVWDSNDDGIPDWWCEKFSLDPTNEATTHADGDFDGCDNLCEWNADTLPNDSNSVLRFTEFYYAAPAVLAKHAGGTQAWRFVEVSADLAGGNWTALTSNQPPTEITNSFGVSTEQPLQFFRIRAYR